MRNPLAIIGLLIVIAVAIWATMRMPVLQASAKPAPKNQMAVPSAVHTMQKTASPDAPVTGAPSISAPFINSVLCKAGSPACGTGQDLYDLGKLSGIDPAYALAFFQHESRYGTAGVAVQTKGVGNIRCSAGYLCRDGFRAYQTWHASYADWYGLISWYISDLHKATLRAILYTYAPPADHNNTEGYIRAVCQAVNTWRKEAA